MKLFDRKDILIEASFFFILIAFVFAFFFNESIVSLTGSYIGENYALSVLFFVGLIFIATVVAPLTVLPFIAPVGVFFFGPFLTALFAIIGWLAGAIVAFLIARHIGRRLLGRFIDLKKLDRYKEYVPEDTEFFSLVLLRLFIPVDILSYAIGLFSRISLIKYSIATAIGITPFAFIISYGVDAFFVRDMPLVFLSIVIGVGLLAIVSVYYIKNITKK